MKNKKIIKIINLNKLLYFHRIINEKKIVEKMR